MQSPLARCGLRSLQVTQVISAIQLAFGFWWYFVRVIAPASADLLELDLKAGVTQVDEVIIERFKTLLARAVSCVFDHELLDE